MGKANGQVGHNINHLSSQNTPHSPKLFLLPKPVQISNISYKASGPSKIIGSPTESKAIEATLSSSQYHLIMQRLLTAPSRILRLRRSGRSARVADESSVNGDRDFDEYNHSVPVSVFVAVLRIPLIAVSCLCQAGGDDFRVSAGQLSLSADEINHPMVHDSRPYAIYV